MIDLNKQKNITSIELLKNNNVKFDNFSIEEKQNLVGAFTWLIEQDKKQNPALYKLKTVEK